MSDQMRTRKALFKAALTNAGMTAKQWCERNDYSEGYLYQTFAGKHDAPPLLRRIDEFIAAHAPAAPASAA